MFNYNTHLLVQMRGQQSLSLQQFIHWGFPKHVLMQYFSNDSWLICDLDSSFYKFGGKIRTIYMKRAWFYLLINPSGNTFPVTPSNDSSPQSPMLTPIRLHLHSGLSVQWARLKLFECRRSGLWNTIVQYCLHKCSSFANNTKC